jgi:ABC-type lipoprotein export system ATPase subunit
LFESLADQGQTVNMDTHEPDIAAHARGNIVLREGLVASDERRSTFVEKLGLPA